MSNIYFELRNFEKREGRLVLATIIATRGSTPQKAGSSALFSKKGLVSGTIGGGILEGKVQKIAMDAALTGKSAIHHFQLDKDISQKEEAICGGAAEVLIDAEVADHYGLFDEAQLLLKRRIPCLLATIVMINEKGVYEVKRIILRDEKSYDFPAGTGETINSEVRKMLDPGAARNSFTKIDFEKPGEKGNGFVLLESMFPPLHLIIAGAGHIGKSLSHIGKLLDFEVTVIDDRGDLANSVNLPDADHILVDEIGRSVSKIEKNTDTYIVIVTRGHNDDASALKPCIGSNAAYIGMIGSRTKIEKMHRNFVENGWASEEQWSKINAPVGLEIGSKTVEEIAVSIAAELILVRNRKK